MRFKAKFLDTEGAPPGAVLVSNGSGKVVWNVLATAKGLKTIEVDFGSSGATSKSFTVVDADILPTSQVIAQVAYDSDEVELQPLEISVQPQVGLLTLRATGREGRVHGKFLITYYIG